MYKRIDEVHFLSERTPALVIWAVIQKGVKQRHGCRCSNFERVAQDAFNSIRIKKF